MREAVVDSREDCLDAIIGPSHHEPNGHSPMARSLSLSRSVRRATPMSARKRGSLIAAISRRAWTRDSTRRSRRTYVRERHARRGWLTCALKSSSAALLMERGSGCDEQALPRGARLQGQLDDGRVGVLHSEDALEGRDGGEQQTHQGSLVAHARLDEHPLEMSSYRRGAHTHSAGDFR